MLLQRMKTPRGLRIRGLSPRMQGAGWEGVSLEERSAGVPGAREIPEGLAAGGPRGHPDRVCSPGHPISRSACLTSTGAHLAAKYLDDSC